MAVNYQQVMSDMLAAGLVLGGGLDVGSGKTVRVRLQDDRERRGWYRLSEVEIDGEYHLVGAYGIWHGNDNGKVAGAPRGSRWRCRASSATPSMRKIRADQAKAKAQRSRPRLSGRRPPRPRCLAPLLPTGR
jgi:putative DNA primase/helicase